MNQQQVWRALERLSTIAVLIACGLLVWQKVVVPARQPSRYPDVPKKAISIANAATLGKTNAPAGMVVFSDFECPFCRKFARESWPGLRETYVESGQLLVAFRHLPIDTVHPHAVKAAEASVCADRQGRFWGFHDLLFGILPSNAAPDRVDLTESGIRRMVGDAGLNPELFNTCFGGAATQQVRADVEIAKTLSVRTTPLFFIGKLTQDGSLRVSRIVTGARPVADFRQAIDLVLGKGVTP